MSNTNEERLNPERRLGRRVRGNLYMLRAEQNDFAPVSVGNDYRLIMAVGSGKDGSMNVIYIGDRLCRYLPDDQLPDIIKERLVMVRVVDTGWKARSRFTNSVHLFTCPSDKLANIGWRLNEDRFCIIVPRETIVSLRGEVVVKEPQGGRE
jgi:hypothetical protein